MSLSALLFILLACCPCASALNPSLDINQYEHHAWTVREGFFKSGFTSIAQTPDGYLWLGTEFGLLRFDGVRSIPWQPPAGEHLPSTLIRDLLAARDGSLWIGTREGLASWKDGKLTHYPELAGRLVDSLYVDRQGTIWAGGGAAPTGTLCAIQSGTAHCYGEGGGFGQGVLSLYEDSRGNLWVGAATGLWRRKPGTPKVCPMPDPVQGLIEGDNGALLISMQNGIGQLVDGKAKEYRLPGAGKQFSPKKLLRDRHGGLWIGTADRALLHVGLGKTDVFAHSDGLSGDAVTGLFEDREGSIWVATLDGLDRFRDFAAPMISVKQGLSNATVGSVLAAKDGSVWLGTINGLNRWNDGQITIYRKRTGLPDDYVESLFQDDRGRIWISTLRGFAYFENGRFVPVSGVPGRYAHAIGGDGTGNLWISHDQSLFHLLGESVVERIPWARLGRKDVPWALLADPVQGGLWLGFFQSGLAYFNEGQVHASYAGADGLGKGIVSGLQLDRDGTLWAATEGGLSRVKDGRVATLTSKNGLPCDTVHGVMEDVDHSFWLYMACGLVRIVWTELEAWVTDPKRTIPTTVFDSSDGVRSHAIPISNFSPRVAQSTDGKLWFVTGDGVSVIDPRHIPFNKLPPPVHIEQITADRKTYETSTTLRLPPLVRDLEIDYTALSLVAPEKIRFRVKLEGHDPDWKDVGNERKAFYNDVPPRNYRFRVAACNNSGVWNEAGASFDFSIDPAYYQTTWFRASCVAGFLVLLWALYRFRLHQIARQFNTRLDERTRLARDLHDTLLQSFHGLMFRFQAVRNMLPRRPEEAMQALDTALERTEQALAEGRDAIQGLRSSTVVTNELAQAVTALGPEMSHEMSREMASQHSASNSARFHVVVEGPPQDLHPILRDEIYAIAREAVRNAFRHAQARNIEADITYSERLLRLRIRDDGKGIDPGIVAEGRAGHYGVSGMRERAKRIGGKLDVWTGTGTGTEIELSIPGSIAYGTSPGRTVLGPFRKKAANS